MTSVCVGNDRGAYCDCDRSWRSFERDLQSKEMTQRTQILKKRKSEHDPDHSHTIIPSHPPRQWQDTISHAVASIVSIRNSQVSAFDTEPAENSQGNLDELTISYWFCCRCNSWHHFDKSPCCMCRAICWRSHLS